MYHDGTNWVLGGGTGTSVVDSAVVAATAYDVDTTGTDIAKALGDRATDTELGKISDDTTTWNTAVTTLGKVTDDTTSWKTAVTTLGKVTDDTTSWKTAVTTLGKVTDDTTSWKAVAAAFDTNYVHLTGAQFWSDSAAIDTLAVNVRATITKANVDSAAIDTAVITRLTGGKVLIDSLAVDTLMVNSKRITGNHHFRLTIIDPNGVFDIDSQVCIVPVTEAALTITRIDVTCDANPDTELDFDLKFANAFIGLASATVIDELNTTNGVTTITSGFNDATVPASKCIYIQFNADPDADIKQLSIDVTYDFD